MDKATIINMAPKVELCFPHYHSIKRKRMYIRELVERQPEGPTKLHVPLNARTEIRWYVSYSGIHAELGVRFYGDHVNFHTDPYKRFKCLLKLQKTIEAQLANGHMPIEIASPKEECINTMADLMAIVLKRKRKFHKANSYRATKAIYHNFSLFLFENKLLNKHPRQITQRNIASFVDWMLSGDDKLKNKTVNNHLILISSLFTFAAANYKGIINENPCNGIPKLPECSEAHEVYSDTMFKLVGAYMQKNDPDLALFSRFIYYCFMRPGEVRQIQLKHIDFDARIIHLPAANNKTNVPHTKFIQDQMFDQILAMGLREMNPEFFLFTNKGKPGPIQIGNHYYTDKFFKIKKHFGLGPNYTMYGFRHTAVCQLIRNNVDKYEIMKYTGHRNLESFEKYLRKIMAERPVDLSDKYSVHL
jgi:integrase